MSDEMLNRRGTHVDAGLRRTPGLMMKYGRLAGASSQHVEAREQLRLAEANLIERREAVAAMRRSLPPGPVVEDYVFRSGSDEVRLSDQFTGSGRALIVFQLMYGKAQTQPCPMCTMWLDGLDGVALHLDENVDLVVVAAADFDPLLAHASSRGWRNLRLLSAGGSTFKFDMGSEDGDGNQQSAISVFEQEDGGTIRHTYTAYPQWSDTDHQRGLDLLSPVWHMLDLAPEGRGDWYPSLSGGAG